VAGALIGAAGFAAPRMALAQGYPERKLNVIIPTGEGGGADRDARAFAGI